MAPFLLGVALARPARGVPIAPTRSSRGRSSISCSPYSLFVGLTLVLLCVLHGATFLGLRTAGERADARPVAGRPRSPPASRSWSSRSGRSSMLDRGAIPDLIPAGAVMRRSRWLARPGGPRGLGFRDDDLRHGRDRGHVFIDLYPRVMVSSTNAANSLTVENASSSAYSLKVMTIVMAGVPAARPDVPGLDVPRVPAPGDHRRPRRLTRARPRPEALPAGAGRARRLGGRRVLGLLVDRRGLGPGDPVREDRGDRVPRRDASASTIASPGGIVLVRGILAADSSRSVDVPPFTLSRSSG